MERIIVEMHEANPDIVIWAKPNAGMPVPGTVPARYDTTPEQMAESALKLVKAGASVIGGCCGTTPEHIKAIANAISAAD
jgi:methionine synthase I (cobalamin-dependent)